MHCQLRQKYKTSDRFGNLMELYEKNYMQLRLLIPELKRIPQMPVVSHVSGCLPVYFKLLEQTPYTSRLHLTYRFGDARDARAMVAPDFEIRVYHDARTAEVVSGLLHGQQHVERKTRNLDDSWRLNRYLYKWLAYLLRRGHRLQWEESANPVAEPAGGMSELKVSQ
ncbi:MAG: DUF1249 domain-containing protein [Pseudomonadota bacterium]